MHERRASTEAVQGGQKQDGGEAVKLLTPQCVEVSGRRTSIL